MISSFLHEGETAAKVGSHRLSRGEVESLIPPGTSSEDSLRLALQYINKWAGDLIYLDVAENQLSKDELDVDKELEEYRMSLLKYRYEQRYINERLDTAISDEQIEEYYNLHSEIFRLKIPILKTRYMKISTDSPNYGMLKKKMASKDIEELESLDSLSYSSADIYHDFSDQWIDVITLAREFGVDYGTMLSQMNKTYIEIEDHHGKIHLAYVIDYRGIGVIPPVEYCKDAIKDILISARKQELLIQLEKDLLEDARESENFVIY